MAVETEPRGPSRVREDYVRALLAADLVAARGVVDDALAAGMPAAAIYLDVLQPTLDPPPYVIVGGRAFAGSRERALGTGADAFADDAADAVRALRERFPAAA